MNTDITNERSALSMDLAYTNKCLRHWKVLREDTAVTPSTFDKLKVSSYLAVGGENTEKRKATVCFFCDLAQSRADKISKNPEYPEKVCSNCPYTIHEFYKPSEDDDRPTHVTCMVSKESPWALIRDAVNFNSHGESILSLEDRMIQDLEKLKDIIVKKLQALDKNGDDNE